MSFLKFLLYVVAAYLVIRFINRLLSTGTPGRRGGGGTAMRSGDRNADKPKFNIEADTVDYEIIEEEKKKDEK